MDPCCSTDHPAESQEGQGENMHQGEVECPAVDCTGRGQSPPEDFVCTVIQNEGHECANDEMQKRCKRGHCQHHMGVKKVCLKTFRGHGCQGRMTHHGHHGYHGFQGHHGCRRFPGYHYGHGDHHVFIRRFGCQRAAYGCC